MPAVGRYFPSQRAKEKVYLLLRRHWFTYAIFILITVLMAVPLVVLLVYWFIDSGVFDGIISNLLIIGVSVYSLFIIGLLLYGFIDYYLDVYIVTNQRIVDIKQNGFFKREIAELHLHQVQDVSARVKGAFPTLLHYGDIHVQTAGEKENFYFKAIPHPYRVSKLIVNLHESHVEQRFKEFENLVDEGGNENKYGKLLEKGDENKEKAPDQIELEDIGSFSKDVFAEARKNTKKLIESIADGSKGETGSIDMSREIEKEEKEMVLKGLNEDEEKSKTQSDISLEVDGKDNKRSEAVGDSNKKGELHENEEIDI